MLKCCLPFRYQNQLNLKYLYLTVSYKHGISVKIPERLASNIPTYGGMQ